jgi:cytochrome c oxidase subunit 1
MGIAVLMMMYLGVLFGVPRRHPSVMDIPGTEFGFAAARPLFAIFGITALLAIVAGALFVVVAVASLLVGDEFGGTLSTIEGAPLPDGGDAADEDPHAQSMRGTFVLTLVFFVTFVVLWALNWFLLSQLWQVGS